MFKSFIKILVILLFVPQISFSADKYESGKQKSQICAACHGPDGNSANKMYPRLAGQYKSYLINSLNSYKNGKRKNAIMSGFVANLSDQDIEEIATYYSKQKGLGILPTN